MKSTRRSAFNNPFSFPFFAAVACLLSCHSLPESPHWTNVSSDYGFFVDEGYFIQPPTFPVSICLVEGSESQANALARALVYWERDLYGHLGCRMFNPLPPGSRCTIQVGPVADEYQDYWEDHYLALAVIFGKKIRGGRQVSRCYVNMPTEAWRRSDAVLTLRHEIGHCLGLNGDPVTYDSEISLMCDIDLPWEAKLTAMDARLIISKHRCSEER